MRLSDHIFVLRSLFKTVFIVNQVRKFQNQYLHNNTGDGTLPQANHAGGAHDEFF